MAPLKWGAEASMQRVLAEHGPFDFILGSDILYSRAAYGDLLRTITFFSQPHTRTWLACPRRDEGLGDGYGGKYFASGAEATLQLLCCAVLRPRHGRDSADVWAGWAAAAATALPVAGSVPECTAAIRPLYDARIAPVSVR